MDSFAIQKKCLFLAWFLLHCLCLLTKGSVAFTFYAGTTNHHRILSVQRPGDHTMYRRTMSIHTTSRREKASALGITLPWFSGKNEGDQGLDEDGALPRENKGSLSGVAGIMDSMDSFKKAQRVGKRTNSLVQELTATTVEGSSQNGKVKVIFDCQQRPIRTVIDEAYFEASDVSEVSNAFTAAMKDAHTKSIERMDDMMKTFYSDLGMPPS